MSDTERAAPELSPRRHDVFLLLSAGKSVKEIARALSIKEATAHNHVTAVYRILNVHKQCELILRASPHKGDAGGVS